MELWSELQILMLFIETNTI